MVETNEYYYIYLNREYAFIMSKIGFEKGNNIEFSEFMKKKIFTKYKNKSKIKFQSAEISKYGNWNYRQIK